MNLPESVEYYACDIYKDLVEFLNAFMKLAGINGIAEVRDVLHSPPQRSADVASGLTRPD